MKFKYIIYFEKENDETFKIFSYLFNYYNYSKMMKILKAEPKLLSFLLYIKYRFNNNTRFLDAERRLHLHRTILKQGVLYVNDIYNYLLDSFHKIDWLLYLCLFSCLSNLLR